MKQAHRMTAQLSQVVISVKDLATGNLKGARSRTIDRVFTHVDGSMTGTSVSVENKKVSVKFRKDIGAWVY